MKKYYGFLLAAVFVTAFAGNAFGVARSWVGIGAGGAGTDFNTAGNWSPAGVPTAADALTININSASGTITLSSSITVGSLTMSVTGNRNGILRANGFVLTVNGAASFNAVSYVSVVNYSYCELDAGNAPGGFVFNGATQIHTTGSGDTYIGGATVSEGTMQFNNNLTIGAWAYTNPGDEPIWSFNGTGTQTVTFSSNYHVKPSSFIFGTTNSPTVNFTASPAALAPGNWLTVYDGNFTVNNSAIVDIGDFDFDPWVAGTTINLNSTSTLRIGNDNNFPGFGVASANPTNYSTFNIGASSTTNYYGGLAQSVSNLASPGYGHIVYGGAGTKTSAGNFSIRGNWTNNGTFVHNSNTHTFDGTVNQTIGGTSTTTFYNLVENKSAGILYMGITNNQVNNVLTLTAGQLNLNSYTLIVNNAATTAVTRTSGYIVSEVASATNPSILQWNMGATTGSFVFPFGTAAAVYIPFTFNKTTATAANVSVSTRATAGTANTPWASGVTHMYDPNLAQDGSDEAVIDRWWHITATAATTANLTFSYRGAENTMIAPYQTGNIGAQYWGSSAWLPNNSNIGSAVAVTAGVGTVTANGVSFAAGTFTPMILSSLAAPLPVEFTDVSANCTGTSVLVDWITATEVNNNYFVVERSGDNASFVPVGTLNSLAPNGNSVSELHYRFTDAAPLSGTAYYRIRQVDFNGDKTYSGTAVAQACAGDHNTIGVYSAGTEVNVSIEAESAGDYQISIFDMNGKCVSQQKVSALEGSNRYRLGFDLNASGVYLVRVSGDQGDFVSRRLYLVKDGQ